MSIVMACGIKKRMILLHNTLWFVSIILSEAFNLWISLMGVDIPVDKSVEKQGYQKKIFFASLFLRKTVKLFLIN